MSSRTAYPFPLRLLLVLIGLFASASAHAQMHITSLHAIGLCISNSAGSAVTQGCNERSPAQSVAFTQSQIGGVTRGALQAIGQCLEARGQGQPLAFAACKGTAAQDWRHTAGTAQIHNAQGLCADIGNNSAQPNASLIGWPCNNSISQKWASETGHDLLILSLAGLKDVPPGTQVEVRAGKLIAAQTSHVIADQVPSALASLAVGSVIYSGDRGHLVILRSRR